MTYTKLDENTVEECGECKKLYDKNKILDEKDRLQARLSKINIILDVFNEQ